jgi:hypothetical protein
MNRRELLEHFLWWIVSNEYDNVIHDDDFREEIIREYFEMNPDSMNDQAVSVPAKNKPDRAARAAARRSQRTDWEDFVERCGEALLEIEDLPDKCNAKDSWYEKVESMRDWAEENEHVTQTMKESLTNILEGALKWA